MNVLIVAKTHVGGAYCIGGLDANNQSLRLYDPSWNFPPATTPYQVGQIWDMQLITKPSPRPPHVEDVAVISSQLLGVQNNLAAHLQQRVVPWTGELAAIFEGRLKFTAQLRGYVEAPHLPSRSTWFWISDQDLQYVVINSKAYYQYGFYKISYVGVDKPVHRIPAGSMVRVSLARWWRPPDADPNFPERCYLQMSGWYF